MLVNIIVLINVVLFFFIVGGNTLNVTYFVFLLRTSIFELHICIHVCLLEIFI